MFTVTYFGVFGAWVMVVKGLNLKKNSVYIYESFVKGNACKIRFCRIMNSWSNVHKLADSVLFHYFMFSFEIAVVLL